jgi:O-succinylbenzoate synthase
MRVSALIHARLPLLRPFRTASGEMTARDIIYVAVDAPSGERGWGEAAPWPGEIGGNVDDVWNALTEDGRGVHVSGAADEAEIDLRARLAAAPMATHIGGAAIEPALSLAVGLGESPATAAAEAAAAGYAVIKLKVVPGNDVARIEEAKAAAPGLHVAVDGNGSYDVGRPDAVLAMAEAGAAYVEQPFPRGSHAAHRRLRSMLSVPLVLDEDVRSAADAATVIATGAADILVIKPAVLGVTGSLRVHEMALDAGLRVKPSGFIESSIGRAHTKALTSLPGAVWADVAPATAFLAVDPVAPAPGGGIGVAPDDAALEPYKVRQSGRSPS